MAQVVRNTHTGLDKRNNAAAPACRRLNLRTDVVVKLSPEILPNSASHDCEYRLVTTANDGRRSLS